MICSRFISAVCRTVPAQLLAAMVALVGQQPVWAADVASERAELALVVRELDMVDRLAAQGAQLPRDGSARYHLDYVRLHADIARVRDGVQDYLEPPRAQPRDPSVLYGHYRIPESDPGDQP
jgi:RAQPRD family integrative conjugative element protein